MGCDEDLRPASDLSLRKTNPLALSISNSEATEGGVSLTPNWFGADISTFNHPPQSIANPTWQKMKMSGADFPAQVPVADVKLMADLVKLNSLQNLHLDPMSDVARSKVANCLSLPGMPNSEFESSQAYKSAMDGDTSMENPLQDGSFHPWGNHVPMVDMNMMPLGNNTGGSTQISRQGRQRKSSTVKRSKYSSTVGFSSSDQLGCSEKIDGSFLTLGLGKDAVLGSKRHFSGQEVAKSLEDAVCPQNKRANIQEVTPNYSTPTYSINGDMPSIQSEFSRLAGLSGYSGGWIAYNNDGIVQAPQAGVRLTPFHGFATSQAGIQHDYTLNSYGNLGHIGNASRSISELSRYRVNQGDFFPPSLPSNSNFSYGSQCGSTEWPGSGKASDKAAYVATQPSASHIQSSLAQVAINTSSVFSSYPQSSKLTGTSVGQHDENQLASAQKGDSMQASDSSIHRSMQVRARNASFPKRLAVQPNDGAAHAIFQDKVQQTQISAGIQFSSNLPVTSFALGQPEVEVPQNRQNFLNADYTTGQATSMVKADACQTASTHVRLSVKRRAHAPLIASTGQHKKITRQPYSQHLMSFMHQMAPDSSTFSVLPAPDHIPVLSPAPRFIHVPPPTPHYIKRKGTERHLQPLGHKCLLCKRDLSCEPEGPVVQPPVAPPAAVLPCGHTFHDHCLQLITPKDQSKDPPCIPCAIGET